MKGLVDEFINILNCNYNIISISTNEIDKFLIIMDKSKKYRLTIKEKQTLIELIGLVADTICQSKYGIKYFQQSKKYEEPELNCCSNLLNYLESEICWDLENEYDVALTSLKETNEKGT